MPKGSVAVLGLGPAGTFAARAAYDCGYQVDLYVKEVAKTPPGAMWLHWIPEDIVVEPAVPIYMIGKGTEANYTRLQWDGKYHPTSSFPTQPVWEKGYDPAKVLSKLLPTAVDIQYVAYALSDTDIRDLASGYDFVFQTFPTRDSIEAQPALIPYVIAGQLGLSDPNTNFVVYNGTGKGIVVRDAQLFGNRFLEFPKGMTIEQVSSKFNLTGYHHTTLRDLSPITKPWVFDHPKIKLVGRWAEWNRKRLSHEVYEQVSNILYREEDLT